MARHHVSQGPFLRHLPVPVRYNQRMMQPPRNNLSPKDPIPPLPVLIGKAKLATPNVREQLADKLARGTLGVTAFLYAFCIVVELTGWQYIYPLVVLWYGSLIVTLIVAVVALFLSAPFRTHHQRRSALFSLIAAILVLSSPLILGFFILPVVRWFIPYK